MSYVRTVANSNVLANIIDIPNELKNRQVEIIILPFEQPQPAKCKSVKGALEKYKNEAFQDKEKEAWASAMVEKHEDR